jgi:hypothetical protein
MVLWGRGFPTPVSTSTFASMSRMVVNSCLSSISRRLALRQLDYRSHLNRRGRLSDRRRDATPDGNRTCPCPRRPTHRTLGGAMSGAVAAEAASRTPADSGTMGGRQTVEALPSEILGTRRRGTRTTRRRVCLHSTTIQPSESGPRCSDGRCTLDLNRIFRGAAASQGGLLRGNKEQGVPVRHRSWGDR